MQILVALIAGVLFGAGLTVSRMVDPAVVLGFLDVGAIATGRWNPTLLMVFAGALPVMFLAYRLQEGMRKPACATTFELPPRRGIDAPLVVGSALFGVGWGLGGICPGPSITAIVLAGPDLAKLVVFVVSMLAGMSAMHLFRRARLGKTAAMS